MHPNIGYKPDLCLDKKKRWDLPGAGRKVSTTMWDLRDLYCMEAEEEIVGVMSVSDVIVPSVGLKAKWFLCTL